MGITFNPFLGNLDFKGSAGSGSVTKYSDTFNNTVDWGAASGGYYTITYLASTHGKGTLPHIKVLEDAGGGLYEEVLVNVQINTSGDIFIKVPDSPDLRFNGLIIVL